MRLLRNLIFKTIRYSGLPLLFRETRQRKTVTIVMFHDPAPDVAARSFAYLAKNYNIISLNDFLEAKRSGDESRIPEKAMIITLDDGHIRNYELLPVIKNLNIPVTIFLCAGVVDTRRHFWFKFKHPGLFKPAMKRMANREKLAVLAEAGFRPEKEFEYPLALNKKQIGEMKQYVNFQGHTLFHPCLPKCRNEEAAVEIIKSKEILEQVFGLHINAIAYPNGDYSDRDIALIRKAGYELGITVDYGFNTIHTDPYRLKRLSIDDSDNVDTVCVKASGVWTLLMNMIGKRRFSGWMDSVERLPGIKKEPLNQLTHLFFLPVLNAPDLFNDVVSAVLA